MVKIHLSNQDLLAQKLTCFLISRRKRCWYSLEVPRGGAANDYPLYMFSSGNKRPVSHYMIISIPISAKACSRTIN